MTSVGCLCDGLVVGLTHCLFFWLCWSSFQPMRQENNGALNCHIHIGCFACCTSHWTYPLPVIFLPPQAGKKATPKDPDLKGPYVNSAGGVQTWGGWSEEAQKKFRSVRDKVKAARGLDHVAQMEQDCLTRLRIQHGVEKADGSAVPAKGKKKAAYDDSDDEFGDWLG